MQKTDAPIQTIETAVAFNPKTDAVTASPPSELYVAPKGGQIVLTLHAPDPEMSRRLAVLLRLSYQKKYSLAIRLITYEGEADMKEQKKARDRKRAGSDEPEEG